jgi:hypothetical protein
MTDNSDLAPTYEPVYLQREKHIHLDTAESRTHHQPIFRARRPKAYRHLSHDISQQPRISLQPTL